MVIGTDILAAKALDDDDDDILRAEGRRGVRGHVDGCEDFLHLCLTRKVFGYLKDIRVESADEGEGCIEHDASLRRTVAVVVGIGDGDRSDITRPTSTHACDTEGGIGQQRQERADGIGFPLQLTVVEMGLDVEFHHPPEDDGCQEEEVPMAQRLLSDDTPQVVLVAEFMEDGACRPSHGILEIHRITEVDDEGEDIHHDEYPFADRLISGILLTAHGEEHHDYPKSVRIKDGRSVEDDTATQHLHQVRGLEVIGKQAIVLSQERDSGDEIHDVGYQQIA